MEPLQTPGNDYVGVIVSLRGLTVEVQILGAKPEVKELLSIPEHPEAFIEVNFLGATAPCV